MYRHPTWICRAPKDVVRMEIQRILSYHVVHQNSIVDVDRALWPSCSAAGEMQKRDVFGHCRGIVN